jgi:nucleoside-diphosphate-sugar epimerase
MKILVVGGAGFIGSWICRELSTDCEVTAVVNSDSNLYRIRNVRNLQIIALSDSQLLSFISVAKPDVIISCDWWGVGSAYRNDERQYLNLTRVSKIALAALENKVKVFIGVGSQAEVGPVSGEILESTDCNPKTIYGIAKNSTRLKLAEIFDQSDTRFLWLRIFSTYGALDSGSWLIPNIVDKLSKSEQMELTAGEQIWNYLHVYDVARAFRLTIFDQKIQGVINVGSDLNITIKEVALKIATFMNKTEFLKFGALPYRDDQVMSLMPVCQALLGKGWYPLVELDYGIKHTINWLQGYDSSILTLSAKKNIMLDLPIKQ